MTVLLSPGPGWSAPAALRSLSACLRCWWVVGDFPFSTTFCRSISVPRAGMRRDGRRGHGMRAGRPFPAFGQTLPLHEPKAVGLMVPDPGTLVQPRLLHGTYNAVWRKRAILPGDGRAATRQHRRGAMGLTGEGILRRPELLADASQRQPEARSLPVLSLAAGLALLTLIARAVLGRGRAPVTVHAQAASRAPRGYCCAPLSLSSLRKAGSPWRAMRLGSAAASRA